MPGNGAGTGVAGVSTGPGQTRVVTGLAVSVGVSEGMVVSVTDLSENRPLWQPASEQTTAITPSKDDQPDRNVRALYPLSVGQSSAGGAA